jgi:hypothetical protein
MSDAMIDRSIDRSDVSCRGFLFCGLPAFQDLGIVLGTRYRQLHYGTTPGAGAVLMARPMLGTELGKVLGTELGKELGLMLTLRLPIGSALGAAPR